MKDTNTYACRVVSGFEVHCRRPGAGRPWEVSLCDRVINAPTALVEGMLWTATIRGEHFRGRTFDTPDDAAAYVRQLLAA